MTINKQNLSPVELFSWLTLIESITGVIPKIVEGSDNG